MSTLKYLPVPPGSLVILSGPSPLDELGEDDMQGFVDQLIVASNHDFFLVLQMDDPNSQIDVVTKNEIIQWLEDHTANPYIPLPIMEMNNDDLA